MQSTPSCVLSASKIIVVFVASKRPTDNTVLNCTRGHTPVISVLRMRYTTMALNRIQYTKLIVQCVTLFSPLEELVPSSVVNKVNKTGRRAV